MLQQLRLSKLEKAPKRDIKSLRSWHFNHQDLAIAKEEQKYLDEDNAADLICVTQKDKTPLRRVIDDSLRLRTMRLWKLPKMNVPEYDAGDVSYYSGERMDRFASAVIIVTGMALLIVPLWILQAVGSFGLKLGVITVFVSIFLLILSLTMVSKPFEALGATAA